MDKRVKFKKNNQRKFFDKVIYELNSQSLRGILQFGINIPYSTLKNYYTERRLIPKDLFLLLCHLAKINADKENVSYLSSNFGQVKGGKKEKQDKLN